MRQLYLNILALTALTAIFQGCDVSRTDNGMSGKGLSISANDKVSASEALKHDPYDLVGNKTVWSYYTERGEYDSVIAYAGRMFDTLSEKGIYDKVFLYAGAFAAQACVLGDYCDSATYYLDLLARYSGRTGDDFLEAMLHNSAALYSIRSALDYSEALEHYKAASSNMERTDNITGLSTILCNIASIYYVLRDSTGFQYAQRAYEISHNPDNGKHGRTYMKVISTLMLSSMYYLKGDNDRALQLMTGIDSVITEFPQFAPNLYLLHAEICERNRDFAMAEHWFKEALRNEDKAEPSDRVLISLRYAEFLNTIGKNDSARNSLLHGLDISRNMHSMEYRSELLTSLADLSVKMGNNADAVIYYNEYRRDMDSMQYAKKERAFRQNQLLAKDLQIKEHELSLVKAHRTVILIVTVAVLTLFILVILLIVHHRQSMMYRRLVVLHQRSITNKDARTDGCEDKKDSTVSDGKDLLLWKKLESMMKNEKIYRISDISLDKLAEILGTNRTYVSRIINKYAGTTFSNYINAARIEYASKILADKNAGTQLMDIAMESGYNSQSSFYRAFVKETGVPPSKYREQILQIKSAC